jgi:predicted nucleic acid-binding protein
MLYFDSSLIVSLLSSEARTVELQGWFSRLNPEMLYLSHWVLTEFQSAMSFKRRTGQLSIDQRQRAELIFGSYVDSYFKTLPVTSRHFHRAADIAGREDINIRAADALHLAIAEASGATVCTLDNKMHHAAGMLEIACLVP